MAIELVEGTVEPRTVHLLLAPRGLPGSCKPLHSLQSLLEFGVERRVPDAHGVAMFPSPINVRSRRRAYPER